MTETKLTPDQSLFPPDLNELLEKLFLGAADPNKGLRTGLDTYIPDEEGALTTSNAKAMIGDVLLHQKNSDALYQMLKISERDSVGEQRIMYILRRLCVIKGSHMEYGKGYYVVIDMTHQLAVQITYDFRNDFIANRAKYDNAVPVSSFSDYDELTKFVNSMQPLEPGVDKAKIVARENDILRNYLDRSNVAKLKPTLGQLLARLVTR